MSKLEKNKEENCAAMMIHREKADEALLNMLQLNMTQRVTLLAAAKAETKSNKSYTVS